MACCHVTGFMVCRKHSHLKQRYHPQQSTANGICFHLWPQSNRTRVVIVMSIFLFWHTQEWPSIGVEPSSCDCVCVCLCVDGITLRASGWSLKISLYWAWDRQNSEKHDQKLVSTLQREMWDCWIYIFTRWSWIYSGIKLKTKHILKK